MGRPEALLGLVPFGPARHENRPTGRAWAVRQARWPVEARPGGSRAIRARALWGRVGPARCSSLSVLVIVQGIKETGLGMTISNNRHSKYKTHLSFE